MSPNLEALKQTLDSKEHPSTPPTLTECSRVFQDRLLEVTGKTAVELFELELIPVVSDASRELQDGSGLMIRYCKCGCGQVQVFVVPRRGSTQ